MLALTVKGGLRMSSARLLPRLNHLTAVYCPHVPSSPSSGLRQHIMSKRPACVDLVSSDDDDARPAAFPASSSSKEPALKLMKLGGDDRRPAAVVHVLSSDSESEEAMQTQQLWDGHPGLAAPSSSSAASSSSSSSSSSTNDARGRMYDEDTDGYSTEEEEAAPLAGGAGGGGGLLEFVLGVGRAAAATKKAAPGTAASAASGTGRDGGGDGGGGSNNGDGNGGDGSSDSDDSDGDDEDIAFAGRTGKNALMDFPHSREYVSTLSLPPRHIIAGSTFYPPLTSPCLLLFLVLLISPSLLSLSLSDLPPPFFGLKKLREPPFRLGPCQVLRQLLLLRMRKCIEASTVVHLQISNVLVSSSQSPTTPTHLTRPYIRPLSRTKQDAPASGCPTWATHCDAVYASQKWKAERERIKKGGAPTGGGYGGGGGGSSSSASSVSRSHVHNVDRSGPASVFTCEELMQRVRDEVDVPPTQHMHSAVVRMRTLPVLISQCIWYLPIFLKHVYLLLRVHAGATGVAGRIPRPAWHGPRRRAPPLPEAVRG